MLCSINGTAMKTTSLQCFTSDYKLQSYFSWFVACNIQDEVTLSYSGFSMYLI